jgi:hypothetical protein
MGRVLHRLGYRHRKGERRHILAESTVNVSYRATYLQTKMLNRDSDGNPVLPEVYLDESYVNVNHVEGKTWLSSEQTRFAPSGKGERFRFRNAIVISVYYHVIDHYVLMLCRICIIGAGIIKRGNKRLIPLVGEFVSNSLVHWNSKKKRKKDEDDDDKENYHGNFDAPQFERWFENLCQILQDTHGSCKIYMDGAAYHKRNIQPAPTTVWKKADIQAWLEANSKYAVTFILANLSTYVT